MRSLASHDLDLLVAIIVRMKKAHEIVLANTALDKAEAERLRDEISVFERLLPKLATETIARSRRFDAARDPDADGPAKRRSASR